MEFAPDTPTAGYERYVSESESTDGEGDVSGGQQRMSRALSAASHDKAPQEGTKHGNDAGHRHDIASGYHHHEKGPPASSSSASSSHSAPSIFSRLAASWKKGSSSASAAANSNGSTATLNGITYHHGNSSNRHRRIGAPAIKAGSGAGGTLWKDMQEGSPRSVGCGDGAGQGFDGGSRATAVSAGVGGVRDALAAGICSVGKSSSGLKGLKTSLLTEDGDIAAAAGTSGTRDGQHAGVDGADGSGGTVDGVVGRGLWDEAAAGDVSALAAALSEGGGGDIHACNADGWTALHSAAHAGQGSAVMCLLVGRGASPASVTRRGFTPLHTACMRGRLDAARALLCLGADANARASDQRTPLHFACEAGSPECVKELLRASASPNVSDQDGRTPLHFACIDGSTECVRRLLAAGASHFPPDAWGRDPAAVARQLHRAGPLQLLEAAAAAAANGGGGPTNRTTTTSSSRRKQRNRGASSSSPPTPVADAGAEGEGDASGGDAVEGVVGEGAEGAMVVAGKRWVVMNESGRMLERRSGKVALFKSMSAAVDWANGVTLDKEITSGSFQVTEVAPSMRRAFEREVAFEITGGGTVSEEEEEEKHDPQWTRYRRQRAAARKAAGGGNSAGGGAGERHRRGAWTAAAQRRDEDEARGLVAAATNKLREVSEEADMHRQKAASLERALEAVLKECDDLAATSATAAAAERGNGVAATDLVPIGGSAAEERGLGVRAEAYEREEEGLAGSDNEEEEEEEEERVSNRPEAAADDDADADADAVAAATAAAVPSLLLGVDDGAAESAAAAAAAAARVPSLLLGVDDSAGDDGAEVEIGEAGSADASDTGSDDDDDKDDDKNVQQAGDDDDEQEIVEDDQPPRTSSFDTADADAASADGVADTCTDADADADADAVPSLLIGVDDPSNQPAPSSGAANDDEAGARRADRSLIEFGNNNSTEEACPSAAAAAGAGAGASTVSKDATSAVDGDVISDGSEDGGEAAALERLAAWLSGLKIRKPDALRYAGSLVADGFDSGEALRGVREEELLQYGMKKGHARLVVTSLKAGIEL